MFVLRNRSVCVSLASVSQLQAQLRALEQQQAGMLGEFGAERQRREAQVAEERQQLEVCAASASA